MKKYNKRVDPRLPKEVGMGGLEAFPSVQTPWGKLIGARETLEYMTRVSSMQAALTFEAMRILIPDYDERCKILCNLDNSALVEPYSGPMGAMANAFFNTPPFLGGGCCFGMCGDYGDEVITMPGRVNDFGQYRVEKELDDCPIAICGSEMGRASVALLEQLGNAMGNVAGGEPMDLQMVEAKCCGDLHCRLVGENRTKYPMPPHAPEDCFGPIATDDLIHFTPEECTIKDCEYFSERTDYKFINATGMKMDVTQCFTDPFTLEAVRDVGVAYGTRMFRDCVKSGRLKQEDIDNTLRWVFEGAGKAMFTDKFAIKGVRDYLGVPGDVNDGRILGGYIEMVLQSCRVNYEIEAFNKDEVIYRIDRDTFTMKNTYLHEPVVYMWNGMAKTMISPMYYCWEEKADAPDNILRIKIARKIDKRGS